MNASQAVANWMVALALLSHTVSGYKVACYYTTWSQYRSRTGVGPFNANNIDFSLCTHILYAFATIEGSQLIFSEPYNDEARIDNLKNLKTQYEKQNVTTKKISVVVQSYPTTFSALARVNASRQAFVNSTIQFLRDRKLDGIELDWSYPSQDDKQSYTLLCQELLQGFIADGIQRQKDRLLLSASVSAVQTQIDQSYEIQKLSDVVDWINIKAYNLFPNQDNPTTTNLHAALFGSSDSDIYSADYAVRWWTGHGMTANKVLLGMPTYGRTFILRQLSNHGILSASNGNGRHDPPDLTGSMAFYAICENQLFQQNKIRDAKQRQVYSWDNDTWVSFDDEQVANEKCSYVKSKGLGGVAIWSLDLDDFTGNFCSRGTYPLIRNVSSCLMAAQPLVNQTTLKAQTGTVQPTTASSPFTVTQRGMDASTPRSAATSSTAQALASTSKSIQANASTRTPVAPSSAYTTAATGSPATALTSITKSTPLNASTSAHATSSSAYSTTATNSPAVALKSTTKSTLTYASTIMSSYSGTSASPSAEGVTSHDPDSRTQMASDGDTVEKFPQFVLTRLSAGGFSCQKPMAKAADLWSGTSSLSAQQPSILNVLSFAAAWSSLTAAAIYV